MRQAPLYIKAVSCGLFACALFFGAAPGAFASSSSALFSSSSLSLFETAKGLIPPVAFCFADEPDTQNPFVPLSVRMNVRRWIHADEHACGKTGVQNAESESVAPAPARSSSVVRWVGERVAKVWSAITDWIWGKIKGEIMHKLGS